MKYSVQIGYMLNANWNAVVFDSQLYYSRTLKIVNDYQMRFKYFALSIFRQWYTKNSHTNRTSKYCSCSNVVNFLLSTKNRSAFSYLQHIHGGTNNGQLKERTMFEKMNTHWTNDEINYANLFEGIQERPTEIDREQVLQLEWKKATLCTILKRRCKYEEKKMMNAHILYVCTHIFLIVSCSKEILAFCPLFFVTYM